MLDTGIRFVDELVGRVTGPMAFRFVLQPTMATLFALRDGLKDARAGRPPYLWTVVSEPRDRELLLREGWKSMLRVAVLGVVMELVYQLFVLGALRLVDLVVVVFGLVFLPYLLLRGPFNRWASRRRTSRPPAQTM